MLDIPLRYDSENMSSLVVARCRFLLYKNLMLEKSYLAIESIEVKLLLT